MLARVLAHLPFVGAQVAEVLLSMFTMDEGTEAQRG